MKREPVPIFEPEWIAKWPGCPEYNKCLEEMAQREDRPLNWSCSDCDFYSLAEKNDILVFKCSRPKGFPLRELWKEV